MGRCKGHEDVIKLLLENDKVDIDSKDSIWPDAVLVGRWKGHEAVVGLLETERGRYRLKDSEYSQTPLSRAAEGGHGPSLSCYSRTSKVDVDSKTNIAGRRSGGPLEEGTRPSLSFYSRPEKVVIDSKATCEYD